MQNLTPLEAARVLYKAETRMGHAIPEEDLKAGKLAQYLKPEDYTPIQNVSKKTSHLPPGRVRILGLCRSCRFLLF